MTLIEMADAVDVAALPDGLTAYAGYIGPAGPSNRYVTFPALVARFYPHAHLLSIAAQAFLIAACLDVETGDARAADAPGWFRMVKAHGVAKPCFYANASTMPAVTGELERAGIARAEYRLWVASYGNPPQPTIPAGFDAHQYTDHGPAGENYDRSVCLPDFFGIPHPPNHVGHPQGVLSATVDYDLAGDHFTVNKQPGPDGRVTLDRLHNRWASAELQANVSTGHWRIKRTGWNKRPLKGN